MNSKDYVALIVWIAGSAIAVGTLVSSFRRPSAQMRRLRWRTFGGLSLLQLIPLGLFAGPEVLGDWLLLVAVAVLCGLSITFFLLGRHRMK